VVVGEDHAADRLGRLQGFSGPGQVTGEIVSRKNDEPLSMKTLTIYWEHGKNTQLTQSLDPA
jgi:hypothetical protein